MATDLLLLNATNLPWRPIFPYAFVQVSAVARQHGLRVQVLDLLDIPREHWRRFLASRIAAVQPRAIGLHIRQGDSVFHDDYYAPASAPPTTRSYFPIDDNRELVAVLRGLTAVPILAGGFGFTTHAHRLFEHLELDLGVQGDPDAVFARFEDVLARRSLETVDSLMFRAAGATHVNARGFYGPLPEREYTDDVFDELVRFYGHAQLFGANPPTVAVEVMRGCPFRCYFCTEPHVKGRALRYRDLDVVEAELDYLMSRQIRRFWMVCSELDIQGVRFALDLAERIMRLRARHGDLPVEWSAYALPRLAEDELRVLQRAGYAGALNDVLSLDDENLRRARVPYRANQAVAFLKAVASLDREEATAAEHAATAEGKVLAGLTQRTPKELAAILGLFLGNAYVTPSTIATTLRRLDDEGLRASYRAGLAFPATRVFAPDGQPICETSARGLRTFGPAGERPIDVTHPTFYYPDFLIDRLGTPDAIIEFLRYVGDTFMSTGHQRRKDWAWFLGTTLAIERFADLLATAGPVDGDVLAAEVSRDPRVERLRDVYAPTPAGKARWNAAARVLIEHVIAARPDDVRRVRGALGLPEHQLTEYRLLERLCAQFATRDALLEAVAPATAGEQLYLGWLLYANNVVMDPRYPALLFGADEPASRA